MNLIQNNILLNESILPLKKWECDAYCNRLSSSLLLGHGSTTEQYPQPLYLLCISVLFHF